MSYDAEPSYPLAHGAIEHGWEVLVARCRALRGVLAVDGPFALPWDVLAEQLAPAGRVERVRVAERSPEPALPGDPVFARLSDASIGDFVALPALDGEELTILVGPGSALAPHDALWYADVPKRAQVAAAAGTEQRLFFLDWPVQERHLRALAARIDAYVVLGDDGPRSVDGEVLRATFAELAPGPFRTRPTFLPGPWGGQWLRRELGIETEAANIAWSYELIAPEASLLLHDRSGTQIEVAFELLLAAEAAAILGAETAARFDGAFPIRFDYLDTLEGGHLSIQCHPSEDYMREIFGATYTQHETYYVVETTPGAGIFHGLRPEADVDALEQAARAAANDGEQFDPAQFLQVRPAERHALYLIPAGTPHASGAGSVVLEISATPYLYTLRFYDWLRRNLDGRLRPVHLEHAIANLDRRARDDLVQTPRVLRAGGGWRELVLGDLTELFFAVHRFDFDDAISDETGGRFHLLNLVAGERADIETASGRRHRLSYAESIVIPAATGAYRLTNAGGSPCKVVKAFVR